VHFRLPITTSLRYHPLTEIAFRPEFNIMKRFLSVVCLVLFLAAGAFAADEKKMTITWHGQSFFEIKTSAGTRIVLDPHAIEAYGRISGVKADLIISSHQHTDHTRVEVVENIDDFKPGSKDYKRINGVTGEKVGAQKWNLIKEEKFKDVTISIVGTYHDDVQGIKRGLNSAIILEVDGVRIVHLGDLGHKLTDNDVKRIGKVDILMIPVGGVYTINGSEAKEVVEQLKPTRFILPMHYGTDVFDDLLPAKEFLEDQKNVDKRKTNEFSFDPSSKEPKAPSVMLLNWSPAGK
jgi:L-ascorbate metabolism protein UlaG (beta-lactamase superfamily)